jgi:hypothetical protein
MTVLFGLVWLGSLWVAWHWGQEYRDIEWRNFLTKSLRMRYEEVRDLDPREFNA